MVWWTTSDIDFGNSPAHLWQGVLNVFGSLQWKQTQKTTLTYTNAIISVRMLTCVCVCIYRCWCPDLSLRKRIFFKDIVSHSTLENWYLDIGNRVTVLNVHSFLACSISTFDKVYHKSLHLMFLLMWHEALWSGEEPRCVYPCLFVASTPKVCSHFARSVAIQNWPHLICFRATSWFNFAVHTIFELPMVA